MEGTLLGAYRDGGFVKGDESDIDIGIHDKYFDRYEALIKRLKEAKFECTKTCLANGDIQGGAFVRGRNHIDVMRMVSKDDKIINYGDGGKLYYEYSLDIFDGYNEIKFYKEWYLTPRLIEQFLTERYGDWKTPVPKSEYSWKDIKYSPNVRCIT